MSGAVRRCAADLQCVPDTRLDRRQGGHRQSRGLRRQTSRDSLPSSFNAKQTQQSRCLLVQAAATGPQSSSNWERIVSSYQPAQPALQFISVSPPASPALLGRLVPLSFFPIPLEAGVPPGLILLAQPRAAMIFTVLHVIPVRGCGGGSVVLASASEPIHEAAQHGGTSWRLGTAPGGTQDRERHYRACRWVNVGRGNDMVSNDERLTSLTHPFSSLWTLEP